MSRATSTYIIMMTVFGAGLWAILSFGSLLLEAPEDLAGEWRLYEPDADTEAEPDKTMFIEQSGRFFKIRLNGIVLDLKLTEETRYFDRAIERTRVVLGDGFSTAVFHGQRRGESFMLKVSGITEGTWIALRDARPYGPQHTPRHVTTPPPTTLPVEPVEIEAPAADDARSEADAEAGATPAAADDPPHLPGQPAPPPTTAPAAPDVNETTDAETAADDAKPNPSTTRPYGL